MEADTCQCTLAGLQSQPFISTTRLPGAKDWSQQLILGTSNPQKFLERLLGEGLHSHRCSLEGFSTLGSSLSFWNTGWCWSTPEFCPSSSKRWWWGKVQVCPSILLHRKADEELWEVAVLFPPSRDRYNHDSNMVTVISLSEPQLPWHSSHSPGSAGSSTANPGKSHLSTTQ